MAKRGNGIAVGVVFVVVLVMLVIAAVGVLTNGFRSSFKTFGVTVNEKVYTYDADGLTIQSGDEFGVTSPLDDGYTVTVYVNATDDNDFSFYVGKEPYKWSDMDGYDVTDGFGISHETDNAFTVTYTDISGIISEVLPGYDIFVPQAPENTDNLFVMVIASGGTSISLGFTLNEFKISEGDPPQGFELSTDHIVF